MTSPPPEVREPYLVTWFVQGHLCSRSFRKIEDRDRFVAEDLPGYDATGIKTRTLTDRSQHPAWRTP